MANGWQEVALKEVAKPISRVVPVEPGKSYRTIGVKWWGMGAYERETIDGSQTAAKTLSLVREGDLIINKIWVRHGSVAIATEAVDGCAGSGEFPTFELDRNRIDPRWIHWQTKMKSFWEKCDSLSRGTSGKNRIKPELFLTIKIPLPPLAEQRRILTRIEALAARIAEAQSLRRDANNDAEAFWGAKAASVLSKVDGERKTIGEICEVRGGLQKSPARIPKDHPTPYLTVAHVQRNRINATSDFRYFEVSPNELERWRLLPGDLLIIEGNGSADQIGRVALFRGEIENCVHQNHVIRARPDQTIVFPDYLNIYLNSPLGQEEVQKRSRTTSGLRTLSVGRIREIEIPIPPLDEQRRIVAYLDGLQAQVSALRALQESTRRELESMLPSVLDRAFKGEL